jgi:hypothetical protein
LEVFSLSSDVIVLKVQRNFLYQEIEDLMLNSIYSDTKRQRIYQEFKNMLEEINKSSVIVEITDYVYQNEEMDCSRILEQLLQKYKKRAIRKGRAFIKKGDVTGNGTKGHEWSEAIYSRSWVQIARNARGKSNDNS